MRVTAKAVFAAKKRWLTKPCLRTSAAYQRMRKAYEKRFSRRRLNLFNDRVEFPGFVVN